MDMTVNLCTAIYCALPEDTSISIYSIYDISQNTTVYRKVYNLFKCFFDYFYQKEVICIFLYKLFLTSKSQKI